MTDDIRIIRDALMGARKLIVSYVGRDLQDGEVHAIDNAFLAIVRIEEEGK